MPSENSDYSVVLKKLGADALVFIVLIVFFLVRGQRMPSENSDYSVVLKKP